MILTVNIVVTKTIKYYRPLDKYELRKMVFVFAISTIVKSVESIVILECQVTHLNFVVFDNIRNSSYPKQQQNFLLRFLIIFSIFFDKISTLSKHLVALLIKLSKNRSWLCSVQSQCRLWSNVYDSETFIEWINQTNSGYETIYPCPIPA